MWSKKKYFGLIYFIAICIKVFAFRMLNAKNVHGEQIINKYSAI